MQCINRLCLLCGMYRPLDSHSFVGSYMVNCFLICLTLVVTVDNLGHVLAVTITYIQRLFIENVVKFLFFREMFFYQV